MNLSATRLHPSWTMLAGDFPAYPGFDRRPQRPQRQIRMFTPRAPLHKHTVRVLTRWAVTAAANYAKLG